MSHAKRKLAVCESCGELRPHMAHGLCTRCYNAAYRYTRYNDDAEYRQRVRSNDNASRQKRRQEKKWTPQRLHNYLIKQATTEYQSCADCLLRSACAPAEFNCGRYCWLVTNLSEEKESK